jgi:rubrerythrin
MAADITKEGGCTMEKLSDAQLSALFSNLSKGCEKQYKPEEAALLQTLSDYYRGQSGPLNGTLDDAGAMVRADLIAYAPANVTAAAHSDRGALRALAWGEKVTKILSALLARFEKNPAAVPGGKNVYVCEICGFVYVGDDAPDICPVCKVPKFKIAKTARR